MKMQLVVEVNDYWVWKHNRSGCYTVKSGYWLAALIKLKHIALEFCQQPSINVLKKQIWSLPTAPKIKTFLWRMLSDALPVADTLRTKGVKMDSICQACGLESESINHVLFTCSIARQVWASMHFSCPDSGMHPSSVFVNFSHVLNINKQSKLPSDTRKAFPWILWILWKNRNKFAIEGKSYSVMETIVKIKEDTDLWFMAQSINVRLEMTGDRRNIIEKVKWKNPPSLWLKCNIGFAWDRKRSLAGVSWVLRNETGLVLMHSRRAFSDLNSLMAVKMQALEWAAESMNSHGLNKVILAIESAELVGVVDRPTAWPAFQYYFFITKYFLMGTKERRLEYADPQTNKCAILIALSVIRENRLQSYVARGHPFWLNDSFQNERICVI